MILVAETVDIQNYFADSVQKKFEGKPTPEAPPDGVFKEQKLGPISVSLQTVSGGAGGQQN